MPMKDTNSHFWHIDIDTGGTFTDCLALSPDNMLFEAKVLSSSALRATVTRVISDTEIVLDNKWRCNDCFPVGMGFRILGKSHNPVTVSSYCSKSALLRLSSPLQFSMGDNIEIFSSEEPPVLAARLVTGTQLNMHLPPAEMRLATTRGTNALLTRDGSKVAFFVTKGFRDLLEIGDQTRPDLFALDVVKRNQLYSNVVEVGGRLSASGEQLSPLNLIAIEPEIRHLLDCGVRDAAVALLHSYINPCHERELKNFLLARDFENVFASADIAPFIKIVPRAETTVVNAYIARKIDSYLNNVAKRLSQGNLFVMTSAGGLNRAGTYTAKDSLLSGPAGGVSGAAAAGRASGYKRLISFDMGGTSTDVARISDGFDYVFEHVVGEAHLVAPALAIETVAAGGGSICGFDGASLTVGPESAGAKPGPACYGDGGPLTLTDVNLLLGRLDEGMFEIPIVRNDALAQAEQLRSLVESATGESMTIEAMLEGLLDIADERMADAIRRVSIRKGYDPAEYSLLAFGGAGGQHACSLAAKLDMRTAIIPRHASLLSAFGLRHACIERFAQRQVLQGLNSVLNKIERLFSELDDEATALLSAEGVPEHEIVISRRIADLRYFGQDTAVSVEFRSSDSIIADFEYAYCILYGFLPVNRGIECVAFRSVASTKPKSVPASVSSVKENRPKPERTSRVFFNGAWHDAKIYLRDNLKFGDRFEGVSLVFERHSATFVASGWNCLVDSAGALILKQAGNKVVADEGERPESVRLELFTNRFSAIVGEMGEMLRRTAFSTNVKERLDFSCSLHDSQGSLVANAHHIPVHLGAMGLCVRETLKALQIGDGDSVITNSPEFGGSHLPDVTVITGVYLKGQGLGFVASRAHHAEIGGIHPGSMSPTAQCLAEEGVVIPPTYLIRNGRANWSELENLLTRSTWPTRALDENLADIRAALAANTRGAAALKNLAEEYGCATVLKYMAALKQKAEFKARAALSRYPFGVYSAVEYLDDGTPVCVRITISDGGACVDFTGTGAPIAANLNATPAVVSSAVSYVLRLLIDEPLPLNDGLLDAVNIVLPYCLLNPDFSDPASAPAVAGGNVETSQCIVDVLIRALNLAACSQGTMNNVIFCDSGFSYYETICGGCGATERANGASAVHSHMTNTRITDPEVIEHRYPVRLVRFQIRQNSAGTGAFHGGEGVVREFEFLRDMSLSVVGRRRVYPPYGMMGGGDGACGLWHIIRKSGQVTVLNSTDTATVFAGDRLVIETPGGGGWGKSD